jgi:hypothetical protein
MTDDADILEQLEHHLGSAHLHWLLGAGICKDAHIPLMAALTEDLIARLSGHTDICLDLSQLLESLGDGAHVEHLLSHLCDACTMAKRSRGRTCRLLGADHELASLERTHNCIQEAIVNVIRCGLAAGHTPGAPLPKESVTDISWHLNFVNAVFVTRQRGVADRRTPVQIFTTNYDTLLEDAMALKEVSYWDGFSGGALAYRSYGYRGERPSGHRAHLIKLHGSIDWRARSDGRVFRTRHGDQYPTDASRVVIYPQATKYIATQKDPFSSQFDMFRGMLNTHESVLAICGYSFGDDHINDELVHALEREGNRTTVLAFARTMPSFLEEVRGRDFGKRIYVLTEGGVFVGDEGPKVEPAAGTAHSWWTFTGVIDLLLHGPDRGAA